MIRKKNLLKLRISLLFLFNGEVNHFGTGKEDSIRNIPIIRINSNGYRKINLSNYYCYCVNVAIVTTDMHNNGSIKITEGCKKNVLINTQY
jgi:hypothetical protein